MGTADWAEGSSAGGEQSEPGIITLRVLGEAGSKTSRAVTGPAATNIAQDALRNVMQLIVLNGAGEIVSYAEARKGTTEEGVADLNVSVQAGETYHFLFLQGHWPYTAINEGVYVYDNDELPTLLQAGFVSAPVTRGTNVIPMAVRSLVADAVFVPAANLKVKGVEPGTGKVSYLIPGEWSLTWTIQQGWVDEEAGDVPRAEGNGFEALVNARKVRDPSAASPGFTGRMGLVDGEGSDLNVSGNVISLKQTLDADAGTHYANFNLEYVPFGLTTGWNVWDSAFFDLSAGPVWIIRNGTSDAAQDEDTDYSAMGENPLKNGNGAVKYTVLTAEGDLDSDGITNRQELQWGMNPDVVEAEDVDEDGFSNAMEALNGFDPTDPLDNPRQGVPGPLTVKKVATGMSEVGVRNEPNAYIQFITGGYSGTAKGYYKAVAHDAPEPAFTDYIPFTSDLVPGLNENIAVDMGAAGDGADVYVIIMKDRNVSLPVAIPLKTTITFGSL